MPGLAAGHIEITSPAQSLISVFMKINWMTFVLSFSLSFSLSSSCPLCVGVRPVAKADGDGGSGAGVRIGISSASGVSVALVQNIKFRILITI